jgi:GNAT superfamily N-acetyltransferase
MIRSAVPADVPAIVALVRELAEYERLAHEVVAEESAVLEHLFGARPYAEVLMAIPDDAPSELVGFALFFHNYSTFLGRPGIYLEDLYVRAGHRGSGLGRALLVRLAQLARERGCGRLEWSVLDWNEPSIEFYRALGAVAMDEWTGYRLTGDALAALAGG